MKKKGPMRIAFRDITAWLKTLPGTYKPWWDDNYHITPSHLDNKETRALNAELGLRGVNMERNTNGANKKSTKKSTKKCDNSLRPAKRRTPKVEQKLNMESLSPLQDSATKAVAEFLRSEQTKLLKVLVDVHPHHLAMACGGAITGSAAKVAQMPNYVPPAYSSVRDMDICVSEEFIPLFQQIADAFPKEDQFGDSSYPQGVDEDDPPKVDAWKPPVVTYCSYSHMCNVDVFPLSPSESEIAYIDDMRYVKLAVLLECAKKWNREKDKAFLAFYDGMTRYV